MHYYTRTHVLHDVNTFRERTRTCKYRSKRKSSNGRERSKNPPIRVSLTRHSRSGKHGRLGHLIGTREMSRQRGRSLRSIHFIWFLTTWVTVGNSSKCVFVLISMVGRVNNSHYSSCYIWIMLGGLTHDVNRRLPGKLHFVFLRRASL